MIGANRTPPRSRRLAPHRRPAVVAALAFVPPYRRSAVVAALAFVAVTAVIGARLTRDLNQPGQPTLPRYGMADFRDTIYYPSVAFWNGDNPYDPVSYLRGYPVNLAFALYAPHTLVVHLPLTALTLPHAELVYFVFIVALMPIMALLLWWLCGRSPTVADVFAVAAALLISRPGESNLYLGQYTATVCVGVLVALYYARHKPWIAAIGVALALLKPTFGAPLVILLLARGDRRPVVGGLALAALLALAPVISIGAAIGSPQALVDLVRLNLQYFYQYAFNDPQLTVARIDAVSLVGRWFGGAGRPIELAVAATMLAVGAVAVARLARAGDVSAQRLSDSVVCVTIVACVYHQSYDALLLSLPLAALLLSPPTERPIAAPLGWLVAGLLAVLALNYVSTFTIVERLGITGAAWTAITSLNAAALVSAWAILAAVGMRMPLQSRPRAFGNPAVVPVGPTVIAARSAK